MNTPFYVKPDYRALFKVLYEALDQAQHGKGKERHANNDELFEDQEICAETRKLGLAAPAFQARKKIRESIRLFETKGAAAAIPDLLGAINYTAAMVIVMRQMDKPKGDGDEEKRRADHIE